MRNKMKKGFTLVELMIVVAIMSILAAVSAPRFGSYIRKAKDSRAVAFLGTWRTASGVYYTDNDGDYASNLLELKDYVDNGTEGGSYTADTGSTTLIDTTTGSVVTVYFEVGTSGSDTSNPRVTATYTTDGAMNITTTTKDTKGNAWNTK